jgi:hypothetical protein
VQERIDVAVFVLDRSGKPLMPCSEKRARLLLERGRARVHRVLPFVIRLADRHVVDCELQPLRIKLDPGSKKRAGNHFGRVAVRASGSFNIQKSGVVVQGVSCRHCRLVQRGDGFGYAWSVAHLNPGNFPVSSHNLPSCSRTEVAVQPCG